MYEVKTKVKNKVNNESEITGGGGGQFPEDCFGPPKCPPFAFVHH